METVSSDGRETNMVQTRIRKGGRFMRFLRGVGWTLLGLVGLALILAVLGMIIPPPRDPKSAALDDEDFGLGFKVGDKWDVKAMGAALEQRGLDLRLEPDINPSSGEGDEEYRSLSAFWWSRDGRLDISSFSSDKGDNAIVQNIGISSFIRTDWNREEAKAFYDEMERKYPDSLTRDSQLARLAAKEVAELYPQLVTSKGLGIGSKADDFYSAYGKSDAETPSGMPGFQLAFYFRDHQAITVTVEDGLITCVYVTGYPLPRALGRPACWIELFLARRQFSYQAKT
jgi:hypothetical protein